MDEFEGAACRYEIDAADRICAVSERWLAFARENDAPELTREAVIGRSLWDFIAGAETRDLYRPILRRVREEDVSLIVPFRCDSPIFQRWMRLVLTPGSQGAIRLDGVLVRKLERLHLGFLEPHAPRRPHDLPICSCCKRVKLEARWLEAEDAIARLHTLGVEPYPELRYVVCRSCRSLVSGVPASGSA